MKVLMISGDRKILDSQSAVYQRAKGYSQYLDELVVIVPFDKEKNVEIKNENLTIVGVPALNKIFGFFRLLSAAKKVASEMKDSFIVTAQDPFYFGFIASKISQKFKVPLEIQVHTDVFEFTKGKSLLKYLLRKSIKQASGVRVVSRHCLHQLEKIEPHISSKVQILPIIVEENNSVRSEFIKDKPTILIVSRLEKEKNIPRALRIFRKVKEKIADAELRIMGEGSLQEELERKSVELNIASNVTFLGFVNDTQSEYLKAQILLHTADFEGFGMVFVEAAQAGLPIVSVDTGVARDMTKYVFGVNEEEKAATHVINLLKDQALWKSSQSEVLKNSKKFIMSKKEYEREITNKWYELLEDKVG